MAVLRISMPRTSWIALLLFSLNLAVFSRALANDFVEWDDHINIYLNRHIETLSFENVRWMLTDSTYVRRYIPLAWIGWGIEHALFGLNPFSYHLGNLLLHATN